MKKITLFFASVCASFWMYAQAPANYYQNATGTGYVLKSQLKTIISNGHNAQSYGALWDLYSSTSSENGFKDKYYENDNTILDIYSEKPQGTEYTYAAGSDQCGNYSSEGDCYNREHLIPQSYFDEQLPMRTDAFHVWPTDGKVNNERGNYPFGTVASASYTSQNGTKRGTSGVTGYSGTIVEPIDEFKGDIARAFFYFATRYEDFMDDFYEDNSQVHARVMFDGSTDKVFNTNFLNVLYQWHIQDPVSTRETDINNLIYDHQGNRNPYIDNPEYVTAIWFPELLNTENVNLVEFNVYPNPAKHHIVYISSKENIRMISISTMDGKQIKSIKNPVFVDEVYKINGLTAGIYLVRVQTEGKVSSKKLIVE